VASASMARKLSRDVAELMVPPPIIELLELDGTAGVKIACDLVHAIRDSAAFDGVHLIPVSRYREVASLLDGFHEEPRARPGRR
jgi:methylenetetrahydrofolate reductase (NADPH)